MRPTVVVRLLARRARYLRRVVLLVIAVVIGLAIGLSRPRAGAHAVRPHLEQVPLLAVGAALNAMAALLDGTAANLALAASLAILIAVAMANRHITGAAVVGLGLLLNLVAVSVNGGVPVRASAMVEAGMIEPGDVATVELTGPRHLETPADAAAGLGDIIPVPFVGEVVSFGDLIVIFGAADAVRELSRRRARREVEVVVPADARQLATMTASADQVWGTAPRARPVPASQYSANPDDTAPVTIDLDREAAAVRAYTELVDSQSR